MATGRKNTALDVLCRLVIYEPTTLSTGCWEWPGYMAGGYGMVAFEGKTRKVHQVVWELLRGPRPSGLEPDHLCRNRACANPDHLNWVTSQVNVLRGEGPSAVNARKSACIRGHKLTEDNVYLYKGKRYCRECMRDNSRRWKQSKTRSSHP